MWRDLNFFRLTDRRQTTDDRRQTTDDRVAVTTGTIAGARAYQRSATIVACASHS